MWTAPEVASAIRSARARPLAPPMSAISPVRSLLAPGRPEDLQHDRAAPARRQALPLSGCFQAGGQVAPPLLKLIQHVRQRLHRVSPPFWSTAAATPAERSAAYRRGGRFDRQADDIGQPPASSAQPRRCGAIAAGWWSWHPGLISRDASRVQWRSCMNRRSTSVKDPVSCALMSGLSRGVRRWPSWVYAYVSGTNLYGVLEAHVC